MAIRTIPSLVVGLGGTGKRALTHLKRRILDTYHREDLPWVRLLSIDADDGGVSNPPIISQFTGEQVHLGISEIRVIDQSDTPKIISNLEAPENRHIKDWYPDPDLNVDFPKAAKGSGQVRMFGRAGLYKGENLYQTYRWLQQAAQDVSDPAAWDDYKGFDIDPGIQFVYVICSLCGGTGSGMFLDIAYLLRKVMGVDPSTRRFVGMFVLPEVYEGVVENQHIKRIYANTYAALRELDFLMNSPRRSYKIRAKDHQFVDFDRDVTPFDFAFLFSNKNKRGAVISQRQVNSEKPMAADDRVCQYISETIMTDILSPVTERNESILSNIFTNVGEPEQLENRTLYKSYSAVGVASVKVPPLATFEPLILAKITDTVVDFMLRPDPDITERALARQFFTDHLQSAEEQLSIRGSLNNESAYERFRSKAFLDEMKVNRPNCVNTIKEWVDQVLKLELKLEEPLDLERSAVHNYKELQGKFKQALDSAIRNYAADPRYGYSFICEWLEELEKLCQSKHDQIPHPKKVDGDPKRLPLSAFDSLQRVGHDLQLPVLTDTMSIMLQRMAEYYDGYGREERFHNLVRRFYASLADAVKQDREKMTALVEALSGLQRENDEHVANQIAEMDDISSERVLIDKPVIGRKEVERFVNFMLSPIWANGDWQSSITELSNEIKARIDSELAYRLVEITSDASLEEAEKLKQIKEQVCQFVRQRIFDQLFPVDPNTGRLKEPAYVDADGRSIIFDFGPDNLLSLLVAHSSPLWSVQTHQVAAATSPITFIGLNGARVPDKFVELTQKHIPSFRPTDLVLSDVEPRLVVKQYDPLYSLASLSSIIDYENYYKATDRKQNPLHTDIRFVPEPNPYLQWLSYKSPEPPSLKMCSRGSSQGRTAAARSELA